MLAHILPAIRKNIDPVSIDILSLHRDHAPLPDEADIVVNFSDVPKSTNISCEHLVDIYGFPACSPNILPQVKQALESKEPQKLRLLHGDDLSSWSKWLSEYADFAETDFLNAHFDDFNMTILAAVRGTGLIMADFILCAEELKNKQLVPIFDTTIHEVSYKIFSQESKLRRRVVRRVFSMLVKELRV